LRSDFPDITPTALGTSHEARVAVDKGGQKRLDVKVTDPTLGLLLCVSIKTYSFQDYSPQTERLGRWTKNIVRNDHELRGEAMVLHQRQPYAVLVGLLFEPYASCDDGSATRGDAGKSSFAHHVTTLAKRSGRGKRKVYGTSADAYVDFGADDPRYDLFERVFIGLYETDDRKRGAVRFFDVETPPPRAGRPDTSVTISFPELVAAISAEVSRRNRLAPVWADDSSDDD